MRFDFACGSAARSAFLVVATVMAIPGVAHAGFLEELFGGGAAKPAMPSGGFGATPDYNFDQPTAPAPPRRRRAAAFNVDTKAQRQQTTDLMRDKTLRRGDAVMMKDGIHIYAGSGSTQHNAREFLPLDADRHVASAERAKLAAIDTTRNDPLRTQLMPDTIASGRSAAVGAPVSNGFKITDARGNSIRYVGP